MPIECDNSRLLTEPCMSLQRCALIKLVVLQQLKTRQSSSDVLLDTTAHVL